LSIRHFVYKTSRGKSAAARSPASRNRLGRFLQRLYRQSAFGHAIAMPSLQPPDFNLKIYQSESKTGTGNSEAKPGSSNRKTRGSKNLNNALKIFKY